MYYILEIKMGSEPHYRTTHCVSSRKQWNEIQSRWDGILAFTFNRSNVCV
jgi:hypothetical protein